MKSLVIISRILYFLLLMIFLSFSFIYQKSSDQSIHINIILLFLFLLLPLIDSLYHVIIEETRFYKKLSSQKIYASIAYVISVIALIMGGYFSIGTFILLSILFSLYLKIDGKIFFVAALFTFVFVAFYLVFGLSGNAESLSIYAYYFLIAGVLVNIFENIIPSKYTS